MNKLRTTAVDKYNIYIYIYMYVVIGIVSSSVSGLDYIFEIRKKSLLMTCVVLVLTIV